MFSLLFKLIKPAILVLALVDAYLLVPAIGNANGKTLHRGVVSGVGGSRAPGNCVKRGTKTWRCRVYPKAGNAAATYSVRLRDGEGRAQSASAFSSSAATSGT